MLLDQSVVVVTGGAGLIGQEFVKSVVMNGGTGIIADINETVGQQVREKIIQESQNSNVDFIKLDINSKDSINEVITALHSKYLRIDALVNNAYPKNKKFGRDFFEVEYDDFCENVNMHLGGYFLSSQQMAEYFKEQGYGNIVNMASIYGLIAPRYEIYENTPMTGSVEYAAIKSAIIHLTKFMAKKFKGMNIRVNSISPGGISDNQPESFLKKYNSLASSKGMLDRSDISGTLLYLLSDMSQYVNGQNIIVDDGWTL